jgi:hypothetical protein
MSWLSGLSDMFSGGDKLPAQEQVTMYIDLECEETGKPFSIGGFSLPAEHDPSDRGCYCVQCFSSHLEGLNGLAEIEEAKKRRR